MTVQTIKNGILRLVFVFCTMAITMFSLPLHAYAAPRAAAAKLTLSVYGDQYEKAAYEKLVAAFQDKNPDIEVNLVYTPGEDEFKTANEEDAYRQRLSLDFASNKPPDVFLMNYREYGIFAERGQIESVGPYLDKSTAIKSADFYPEAFTPFTHNNVLDCLPQSVSGTVIYYNKTLFDSAKLAYPKDNWTWDDFLKTAQALTNAEKNQYGLGVDPDFTRLLPFIWQNGGTVAPSKEQDSQDQSLILDTPEIEAAMQWFVDLQGKYHVVPDELHARSQSVTDRFLAGNEGMLIFSRRMVPSLRQASFDWDVAPLPQAKQAATLLYSAGYCMAKGSQNKAAAWKLIEYVNSPEGQTLIAKSGLSVPTLKAVANSPVFLDPNAKPQHNQIFLDLIKGIQAAPVVKNYADIEEEINRQLEGAFYGDQSVQSAIEAMQKATGAEEKDKDQH